MQKDLSRGENGPASRYLVFTREAWARRPGGAPPALSQERMASVRGIAAQEVERIYLPLSEPV
jgi:pantothenate kinase